MSVRVPIDSTEIKTQNTAQKNAAGGNELLTRLCYGYFLLHLRDELGPLIVVLGFVVHEGVRVEVTLERGRPAVHARGALVQHQVPRLHGDVVVVAGVVVDHQRPVFFHVLHQYCRRRVREAIQGVNKMRLRSKTVCSRMWFVMAVFLSSE